MSALAPPQLASVSTASFEAETQNASIEKASLILSTLAAAEAELGVMEISRRIGLNKSTVSRLVSTLHHLGLVERSERGKRYRLGIRVFELGMLARERLPLVRHARVPVAGLAEAVGFVAALSVLAEAVGFVAALSVLADGGELVLLSHGPRGADPVPGVWRRPAAGTASGLLLLAAARDPGPCSLASPTRSGAELAARAAEIRRLGFAVERVEASGTGESRFGVAAPVHDHRGQVVAALSVGGPSGRFDPGLVPHLTSAVCGAAVAISQRLGHRPAAAVRLRAEPLARPATAP